MPAGDGALGDATKAQVRAPKFAISFAARALLLLSMVLLMVVKPV
jgi:hypothetical protein